MQEDVRKAAFLNHYGDLQNFEQQPIGLRQILLCAAFVAVLAVTFSPLLIAAAATNGIRKAMEPRQ